MIRIEQGDCLETMVRLADEGILLDAVATDPPYHLTSIVERFGGQSAAPAKEGFDGLYARASAGFMNQVWDGGDIAFRPETWRLVYALMKPGAHLVAFSGTRTYHRMVCAIEDAGFEIRDQLAWVYSVGFPKSHAVAPVCLIETGQEFDEFGTALKPSWEPIVLARKPISESSIATNILRWGTGAINIGGCRISTAEDLGGGAYPEPRADAPAGRWPANLVHDGSAEVVAAFPNSAGAQGNVKGTEPSSVTQDIYGKFAGRVPYTPIRDGGSAARFWYSAKADSDDRWGSKHPTVKPVDLMRWLARLITPPGGLIMDPFAGSGTTGVAAMAEGFSAILCEREKTYLADIRARIDYYSGRSDTHRVTAKARNRPIHVKRDGELL